MVPPKNAKGRLVSLRKNRWRGNEDTRREAGDTLVEVLVSLVVIGISATALLGAFATTLSATSDQRSLVGADAFLRSFVETATYDISLSSSPAFVACASSVPAAYSQIASSASNSTYTLTLTGISAPPSGCSTSRPASEQIAVKLASTMGASDSTTFVVYPPSGTAGAGTILNSGTSISPNQGPAAGGTTVTITGNGFTGATSVAFGSVAATSFSVLNNTTITAVSPAGTGSVDVTVTTGAGTSPTNPFDQFTYAPTVTAIAPTTGGAVGGTTVTITGTGFLGATGVQFGTTAASSYSVVSASSITAVSPAGSSGTVDVTVTTAAGTSTTGSADKFTYGTTVSGISPSTGPDSGGQVVSLLGSGFTGATSVKFGTTAATSFTVNSDASITATAPAGTGTVDITVTSPSGTSATSVNDRFTYAAGSPVGLGLVIKTGSKTPVAACASGTGSKCRSPNSTTCMMTSSTATTCDISGIWQGSNSSVTFYIETVDAAGNPVAYSSTNALTLTVTSATPTSISIPANGSTTSPNALTATLASKSSTTTVTVKGGGWTFTVVVSS
jgi:type II secretory pathway pseudopilin PulG